MKKLLLLMLGMLMALPTFARDFDYTYEGQTLTYTVISEDDKTVKTKDGSINYYTPGNSVSGVLIIPATVKDGDTEYSVTSIGDNAFFRCSGLTSVTIPNSVQKIGDNAFFGCDGLTSVTIPESVTSIGNGAFHSCDGLTSVTIPNSVTSIDEYAFRECSGLTSIIIPNSVTSIGRMVFRECSGLTSVTIPESVTSIGIGAFYKCSGLTSVTIPESVTSIGGAAFGGCSGINSVTIPNSVTSIDDYAFAECSGLTEIVLPAELATLGVYVWQFCPAIKSVVYTGATPIEASQNIFDTAIYDEATLYVPKGQKQAFMKVNPWSYFYHIDDEGLNGVEDVTVEMEDTIDFDKEYEVYNLSGAWVGGSLESLSHGFYIVRQSNMAKKVAIK